MLWEAIHANNNTTTTTNNNNNSLLMLREAIHADVAVPREPPEEVGLRRERTRQRARGEENGGAAGAEEAHGTARHGFSHTH